MCNGHHIFKLQPNIRAAIRNLLTRIMLDKGIEIPALKRRATSSTASISPAPASSVNLYGDSRQMPIEERYGTIELT